MGVMGKRGLVLGAGGITGVAWQLGVIMGLREQGVDLGEADLMIGTSAGSITGAILASDSDLAEIAGMPVHPGPDIDLIRPDWERGAKVFLLLNDESMDDAQARREAGALALEAEVVEESVYVAGLARRLPVITWSPSPRLLIIAVGAETGEPVIWDSTSGVPLPLAIAASCAVPCVFPPVTIDSQRWMDGGVRSGINADLAAGCSSVLVLAPLADVRLRGAPQQELDLLRTEGARAELIGPDGPVQEIIGGNFLDLGLWEPSVEAGRQQALRIVDRAADIWLGDPAAQ
jgi:NTE family protein